MDRFLHYTGGSGSLRRCFLRRSYGLFALALLFALGLVYDPRLVDAQTATAPQRIIRVGVYGDGGVGSVPGGEREYAKVIADIINALNTRMRARVVTGEDIRGGALKRMDVVIFPGGTGLGQYNSLGQTGRHQVQKFVYKGGGYIGICAGAYLAQTYEAKRHGSSLQIARAKVFNKSRHWARGAGVIRVRMTNVGKRLLPELRNHTTFFMQYYNGPLLVPLRGPKIRGYDELMRFESNVYHGDPRGKGESPGKTFLLRTRRGRGTVVLMSGHPESTPGFRWLVPRMVEIAARVRPSRYPARFVRANKYDREIMFTGAWFQEERRLIGIVKNADLEEEKDVIAAIARLREMGSTDVCKHFPVLLGTDLPSVRIATAKAIVYFDYFPALGYLKKFISSEDDRAARAALIEARNYLSVSRPDRERVVIKEKAL